MLNMLANDKYASLKYLSVLSGVIDNCELHLLMIFILYTTKQLKHSSFLYYWIYPYSLVVSSRKIAHEAEGQVCYRVTKNRT